MDAKREQICILVACKRTVTCELYSQALNRHSGFRVATTVTTADEVLEELDRRQIDVALVSTELGDDQASVLSLLQQIRDRHPGVKSVLLFDREEVDLVVPAFRAGAKGVFCAGLDAFKNLCRCVERVHAGQIWANSAQLTLVLEAFSRLPLSRLVSAKGLRLLTKREEEIVLLVEEGFTNRDIAHHLRLSEHTVRNNLIRIFDKLGVSTRVELALYAVNHSRNSFATDLENPERGGYELRDVVPQLIRAN
jgi:two-component system nitrate/nitrite response regulator NarL